jgi:dihydroneopterin triphosphate diphosphatase
MADIVSKIVEVCVFRFKSNDAEYLLLKRAKDDLLYPGIWQWVTGSVADGEKARDAAFREFREETGFFPLHSWIVPHVSTFYEAVHDRVHLCPLFAIQVDDGREPLLSGEHEAYGWFSYDEARRRLVWPGQRQGLDLVERFVVGGEEGAELVRISG